MSGDKLPENGASACRLPDPQATSPRVIAVSPTGERIYWRDKAIRDNETQSLFVSYLALARWLIKIGRAKAVSRTVCCDMCEQNALYEYEGHFACGEWCLADVLDEYGLAEEVIAEVNE